MVRNCAKPVQSSSVNSSRVVGSSRRLGNNKARVEESPHADACIHCQETAGSGRTAVNAVSWAPPTAEQLAEAMKYDCREADLSY